MTRKIAKPLNPLIFTVAGAMAAEWYEIGRSQGLTSKWSNARLYAKNNLEKFVPVAIEHLLTMLGSTTINDILKNEIYEALTDPINDPDLMNGSKQREQLDIEKLDKIVKEYEKRAIKQNIVLNKPTEKKTVLHN